MYLALSIVGLYGLLLVLSAKRWARLSFDLPSSSNKAVLHSVSVVVAFRNEETALPALINSLRLIMYPLEKLEFLFINDHSTDDSMTLLQNELKEFPFKYTVIQQRSEFTGKKQAQLQGVKAAVHEIVLTTDADCVVPPNWVHKLQAGFAVEDTHFITGNVTFIGNSFWSDLLRIELAPLLAVTGIAIDFRHPILANGANMAFRKKAYLGVLKERQDIGEIASGDDVFLLEAIKNKYGSKAIGFNKGSVIETCVPLTLPAFYNQRVRWASKWKSSGSFVGAIPALLVWLFHLMLVTVVIYGLLTLQWIVVLEILFFKMVGEYVFIEAIFKSYPYRMNFIAFLALTFFYSFYVIFFGLSANFRSYKWKERTYGRAK